jgi:Bacterial regulatory helix-turn-helix protein, lysR family
LPQPACRAGPVLATCSIFGNHKNNHRPELPPLNALRAFEVAARCGSFVLAGADLGVTSAAISAQVRALEEHIGKRLFLRQGTGTRATGTTVVFLLSSLRSTPSVVSHGRKNRPIAAISRRRG